jgi:hypothetical protein
VAHLEAHLRLLEVDPLIQTLPHWLNAKLRLLRRKERGSTLKELRKNVIKSYNRHR